MIMIVIVFSGTIIIFQNNTENKCQEIHAHKTTKPDFNLTNTGKYGKQSVAEEDNTTKQ